MGKEPSAETATDTTRSQVTGLPINSVERLHDGAEWTTGGIRQAKFPPGSASWGIGTDDAIYTLQFVCPCGCQQIIHVPVSKQFDPKAWDWNRDQVKPTLLPSIQVLSGCRWHGWLRDGMFVTC